MMLEQVFKIGVGYVLTTEILVFSWKNKAVGDEVKMSLSLKHRNPDIRLCCSGEQCVETGMQVRCVN